MRLDENRVCARVTRAVDRLIEDALDYAPNSVDIEEAYLTNRPLAIRLLAGFMCEGVMRFDPTTASALLGPNEKPSALDEVIRFLTDIHAIEPQEDGHYEIDLTRKALPA